MSSIRLHHVGHAYAAGSYALQPADLVFEHGKTYALLGPSGCGKTTMLNIISGLLQPSEGQVLFNDTDVTLVPTARRNIAQVFQFPVIYQSKTVFENLAFPLQCRKWDRERIARRVDEIAGMLGLSDRLGRPARGLTVDEKQLISLGRGLVRDDVAAILMDEPLTVIDPQMKFELRRRIKQAHAYARVTVIYVTHDQNEAMTFADEILVMKNGRVVQRGTPETLFERPLNPYVGHFIGSPGMNFLPLERRAQSLALAGLPIAGVTTHPPAGEIMLGVRPEHMAFTDPSDRDGFPAMIEGIEDHGSARVVEVSIGGHRARMKLSRDKAVPPPGAPLAVRFNRLCLYVDGELLE
ncbi:MAG: ABC transporter ATP-binding protein [Comamonas sp. SCN 67-35]|uniref:ABC transporter ATP-binding protein n=1 Tax=unclassified Comamonas TaxID=2638500 RepID=UPI00086F453F|nr:MULTISPECIES: ABC transporter ATP-binding protein [unclassified Comamonas]MBN9331076.1 ABC transporter ATP-binding protein [Comamonas sp.]ODU37243.1 MAG: ABC transporter ATP-binding protein [Comamonas sp. SCN 67-35]OJX00752.1 MAG: ABC transporter ATP-binding protein [Burkholderiales bacterium 66-26]